MIAVLAISSLSEPAFAQEVSPTEPFGERDTYYPNTEALGKDEMRVIACGTGMPTTRAAQAAACFLVELGNGDKFIFDIGSGSAERISSLQIPYDYLDKVFIGHLHADHFGSLAELWIGGALMGRQKPLRVWGPSGPSEELGTAAAIEALKMVYRWDLAGRVGLVDFRGYDLQVNEFDYKGENAVVYEEDGVTIRSWPAIHSLDGPVSFGLEWNGLKFVFSSDTYPNNWFNEYAKDADLAIHECFVAVPSLVAKMGFTPEQALLVGTQIHTAPEAFGKVMSEIEPRMAVAYHFFKDFDTTAEVYSRIRTTYEGPLSLAEDFMVWNITEDEIRVRLAVVEEATWAPPLTGEAQPPGGDADREAFSDSSGVAVEDMIYSDFILGGSWDGVEDALRGVYKEAEEKLGQTFPYPGDE
ncbi:MULTISPECIES: guanitoxin biosynthesis MBL fold metallo-hydrolase GntH [unclassified Ruegeria]|uniref:guanitoxin biosynthesis MBL fold metallo-hydrolase GntH n=1 Tax=unclassified Ruegeria TaxID=2625375 RepID=UPI0014910B35|nr:MULTISPECIES: guanitoxin biosynthesis MBL fold metallo-hydrolase GntH [unclassified Ruegeria]NOD48918.1 MBL fold metallo-hydrolase [Ruegeria sp. HKCCD5849]NOD53565.1 MBL fold metallo-hydrolase [Ruegeria sp. HKCCD5851]NOD69440.1 MBL fold metallo-hydrolase [Ruegeria sp. HKCCD7303]